MLARVQIHNGMYRLRLRARPDLEAGQQRQIEMVSSGERGGRTESTSPPVDPSQPQQQQPVPIPRVRGLLRRATCHLFTPQTVPIGPYHVQEGSYLFQSTGVKDKAVQHITETQRVVREDLKAVLSNLVNEKVRPCYTHLPEDSMSSEAFSSMLLLDGCYLLCRFIKFQGPTETGGGGAGSSSGVGSSRNGGASGSNGGGGSGGCSSNGGGGDGGSSNGSGAGSSSRGGDVGGDIAADPMILDKDNTSVRDILYLLDNQIPLFVLEAILNYIRGTTNLNYAPELIYGVVKYVLQKQHYISKNRQPVQSPPSDLLHLVYSYFRPGPRDVGSEQAGSLTGTGRWRRATDYRKYADMQFRPRKFQEGQQWTILDMDIEGDTLYIPFLQVNNDTWTILRNLMALEEQEEKRPVTAYCLFMSQVACTAEDVQLLQVAGILEHFMPNDKEAAKGFAYLCDGVAMEIDNLDRNYLKPLWHDLHKRCSVRFYNFKGFFRDKYCSTVFYRLVFCVAMLVFVSEVTQAIYAVIAYHNPRRS
ncbi:uncharacterized protein [Miscanthus floridulus]|uniref:uncharacterized protein n=1 Tax=Miscanthus floridulus TaxID=154761 RepID=UPI003458307D